MQGGGVADGVAMNTAANTPANTPDTTAGDTPDKMQQLVDRIQAAIDNGTPGEVELYQVTGVTRKLIARFQMDQFDPFAIGGQYGGGRYMARLKLSGKYDVSATFEVSGPTAAKPVTFAPQPQFNPQPQYAPQPQYMQPQFTPQPQPTADIGAKDLLAIMLQQQQTSNQMMMQQQQQQTQMFTTLLQASLTKSNATPATDALTMLKEVRQLAREERGDVGGGDDEGFAAVAKQLLPYLAPLLAGGAQTQRVSNVAHQRRQLTAGTVRPQVTTAAGPTFTTTITQPATTQHVAQPVVTTATAEVAAVSAPAPLEGESVNQFELVKRCAAVGMPPRTVAHMIYGVIDDNEDQEEADDQLNSIAKKEPATIVAQLALFDPFFANVENAAWATQVWTELRDIVKTAQLDDEEAQADAEDQKPDAGGASGESEKYTPDVP